MPRIELFSQGEEVVSGQTVDTNAAWISRRLVEMGFEVTRHTCVGDRLEELVALLQEIGARADYCICSGGLGPTRDDLTAEAVSQAFDRPLQEDPEAVRQIEQCFSRWGRPMPAVNRKQAQLPRGARRLDNHWGTAPGFMLQAGRCRFAFVPGVPSEMRRLFETYVESDLKARFDPKPRRLVTLRTFGIGESSIEEQLEAIELPDDVVVSFRAGLPEVHTKLFFPTDFPQERLRCCVSGVAKAIGSEVFSIDGLDGSGGSLAEVVGRLLSESKQTLAIVETASGGRIASQCIGDWFLESTVASECGRLAALFDLGGLDAADEASIARQVAQVVRTRAGADVGLAQFGRFAPAALHDPEQALSLHQALSTPTGLVCETGLVRGPLQRKQIVAAALALDLLRRHLQDAR